MDVTAFDAQLKAFKGDAAGIIRAAQQKICLTALGKLVLRTPVKTGRARGGWQVGINQGPVGNPQASQAVGGSMGAAFQKGAYQTDKSGRDTIAQGEAKIKTLQPFTACHITNNVEYILELEDGKSSQAPGGMMGRTFDEIVGAFQ